MSTTAPICQTISVFTYRGDRSQPFAATFLRMLDDATNGRGPGPNVADCLRFAGHTGVSTDGGASIYGFNPNGIGLAVWQMMENLQNGNAFPGVVRDDTMVFSSATSVGLALKHFNVILPDPFFQNFKTILDLERKTSKYSYGFPNGDGDCNCTTWLERLGLPLLSGRMDEFISLRGFSAYPSRRFGMCV